MPLEWLDPNGTGCASGPVPPSSRIEDIPSGNRNVGDHSSRNKQSPFHLSAQKHPNQVALEPHRPNHSTQWKWNGTTSAVVQQQQNQSASCEGRSAHCTSVGGGSANAGSSASLKGLGTTIATIRTAQGNSPHECSFNGLTQRQRQCDGKRMQDLVIENTTKRDVPNPALSLWA